MAISTIAEMLTAIRARRRSLGWTQQVLADRAGVSRVWLSHMETGKASPTLELLLRVLDALDLDVDLVPRSGAAPADAEPAESEPWLDLDEHLRQYGRR